MTSATKVIAHIEAKRGARAKAIRTARKVAGKPNPTGNTAKPVLVQPTDAPCTAPPPPTPALVAGPRRLGLADLKAAAAARRAAALSTCP